MLSHSKRYFYRMLVEFVVFVVVVKQYFYRGLVGFVVVVVVVFVRLLQLERYFDHVLFVVVVLLH